MNLFIKIYLLLFLSCLLAGTAYSANKKEMTEAEDILNEFMETKFLQIDQLDIPKELVSIEEQIRQNALDVIISSKTHTPVYAQKRDSGYSASYKKFHGLKIQITPIAGEKDFYSLNYFYYNWTNRKFDKSLRKRISKFNVLNELRFGLYELLLGKKFIEDNKDEIEKQNYDRIQAVRENEVVQKRIHKKKKREKKIQEEMELELSSKEDEIKANKLLRGDKDKNNKNLINFNDKIQESSILSQLPKEEKEDTDVIESTIREDVTQSEKNKKNIDLKKKAIFKIPPPSKLITEATDSVSQTSEVPISNVGDVIPTKSTLYAFVNIFNDSISANGLLATTTNLRYLGIGARYIQEQDTAMPRGMRFSLKVGLPIKKDNYAFPVYRAFETEIYKRKILNHFQLLAGLDFSPIYFVNLPSPGEGLKVFENDIFWLKAGIGFKQVFYEKEIELRMIYLKSVVGKSNQKKIIEGSSVALNAYYQHNPKNGAELSYQKSSMVGDMLVASQSLYFSYVYKFEN